MAKTAWALGSNELWKSAAELYQQSQEDTRFEPLTIHSLSITVPNGLRRGIIAEVQGERSAGCASLCLHILAQATGRGEICALVDAHDSFDPASAEAAGVVLEYLVWVRCGGKMEAAIRACDLLLHAGGFGVVHLDLCETSSAALNRIPISYWHRFRRAVEHTPAILLIGANSPQAKSCSSLNLKIKLQAASWTGRKPFCVLAGLASAVQSFKGAVLHPQSLFWQAG